MEERRIALVPAYEPDFNLSQVVHALHQNHFEVIVVNDGSSEDKNLIFTEVSREATLISHEENRGKGAALKTGLSYIREHFAPPYTVVTVDADGQHRLEDVLKVLRETENHRDSLVLGSRQFQGQVPLRSRLGNSLTRLVFRLSSGTRVYDTQTGLRGFSDRFLEELLQIPGDRYEYEMNMLMQLAKEKTPIREIPIETVYLNDNASSHFNPLKDSFRIYKEILKFSGSSLISFAADYLLFCLFLPLTGSAVFANIDARILSAGLNYTLNRKMVFRSQAPLVRSALSYALLAIFILGCNTVLLDLLVTAGVGSYLAKIITEILMWGLSYFVQHTLIFPAGKEAACEKA